MCLLLFGYHTQIEGVHFQAYLRKIPVLYELWEQISGLLYAPGMGIWGQIGVTVAVLYGVSFGLAALCSGIVRLCCRPREVAAPQGTSQENAQMLLRETERLLHENKKQHITGNTAYVILFMLFGFGIVMGFLLMLVFGLNRELLDQIIGEIAAKMFLVVMAYWAGYAILNYPLTQLMRLLYIQKLPEELGTAVNNHLLRSDPEKKAQLEEEDRILKLAEEIKARRKKEREELLKK